VTATTASGFPVNGGTTTFSDTLSVLSLPIRVRLNRQESILALSWIGGTGPYRVQKATNLTLADWQNYLTNAQSPVTPRLMTRSASTEWCSRDGRRQAVSAQGE
jgi:hypothetical protein